MFNIIAFLYSSPFIFCVAVCMCRDKFEIIWVALPVGALSSIQFESQIERVAQNHIEQFEPGIVEI